MDKVGHVVVEIGECNSILRPDQLTDDIFVDIIELVPIFILCVGILDQRLKFGSTRNRHVKRLGGEERFEVLEVKVIVIDEICVCLSFRQRRRKCPVSLLFKVLWRDETENEKKGAKSRVLVLRKRRNQSENSSNWNCMFCSALSLLFANDTRSPCTVWESYDTERGGRARGPLIERRRIPLSSFSFLNSAHIKRSARNRYIQLQERALSVGAELVSLCSLELVPPSSFLMSSVTRRKIKGVVDGSGSRW